MKASVFLITLTICLFPQLAQAEDFILPKSFSVEVKPLPKIEKQVEKKPVSIPERQPQQAPKPPIIITDIKKENGCPVDDTAVSTPEVSSKKTDISLTKLIRNYKYNYSRTLISTLLTLSQLNIDQFHYDSSKGQIIAKPSGEKEIFILLLPSQKELTHVRITPADGSYSLSIDFINNIFNHIEQNICSSMN